MSAFKNLINGSVPVIIHMYAEWASSCNETATILKEQKLVFGESVKMIKIDVDANNDVAKKFDVVGVPTLLLFKEGALKWRHTGLVAENELKELLKKYC